MISPIADMRSRRATSSSNLQQKGPLLLNRSATPDDAHADEVTAQILSVMSSNGMAAARTDEIAELIDGA